MVFRYVFGNADAIRAVARNRAALWTSIVLVLLTGIARNYDQTYFLESPMWLIGPLVFSFFSGSFLYAILIRGFARRHFLEEHRKEKQWVTFMALFWMTAPVAWLYAIPVERFFDPYRAAQANITLLGIVSLWRVLLMSRIMSVLFQIHYLRALAWVLLAAAIEVYVVTFLNVFFGGSFSRHVFAAMAGMRNSPEEALLGSVLGFVLNWSWAVLVVCLFGLASRRFRGTIHPLPKLLPAEVPWLQLAVVAGIWAVIAIGPQIEQQHFITHAALIHNAAYSEALAYLGKHQKGDFPPSRRLEPNPYEFQVWDDLPPTIALLTPDTAPWIRHVYLNHVSTTLTHYYSGYALTNVAPMLSAIEQLPEGREWFQSNGIAMAQQIVGMRYRESESTKEDELVAKTNILETLTRMGIAQTNLTKLTE